VKVIFPGFYIGFEWFRFTLAFSSICVFEPVVSRRTISSHPLGGNRLRSAPAWSSSDRVQASKTCSSTRQKAPQMQDGNWQWLSESRFSFSRNSAILFQTRLREGPEITPTWTFPWTKVHPRGN